MESRADAPPLPLPLTQPTTATHAIDGRDIRGSKPTATSASREAKAAAAVAAKLGASCARPPDSAGRVDHFVV